MPASKVGKKRPQLKKIDDLFVLDGNEGKSKYRIQEIAADELVPFKGHPFRIYQGERLHDMIESVKTSGVLVPVVVRKTANDELEILAGHNRVNAAKCAGLETVPTVVLEDISDEEAMVYVVETNLMQRSFGDMLHSEKAKVISMHHSKMFSQGKRNDILEHLKVLENPETSKTDTLSHNGTELDKGQRTDEKIGEMYGLARNTVARYLRIDKLVHELKELLDDGAIPFLAAVEVSFLHNHEQRQLVRFLNEGHTISERKAKALRAQSKAKTLDEDTMRYIIVAQIIVPENKPRRVNISSEIYGRYFKPEQSAQEVESIVEEALKLYFDNRRGLPE